MMGGSHLGWPVEKVALVLLFVGLIGANPGWRDLLAEDHGLWGLIIF